MNATKVILAGLLWIGVGESTSVAQATNEQFYTLISGSQLLDDCPICARPTIVVPMAGTFGLRVIDQNPLNTTYEVFGVSFHAGATPGPEYQVMGSGTYQTGGEVATGQDMYLDVTINNGYASTEAQCVNTNRTVSQPWPGIQISLNQTNGTPGQVYYLTLVAIPIPKLRLFPPDSKGNVSLEWDANGGSFEVERAPSVTGPYSAVSPITTNFSFTDFGVMTNFPRVFYRLRQF